MSLAIRRTTQARRLLARRRVIHLVIQTAPIETICPRCLQPEPTLTSYSVPTTGGRAGWVPPGGIWQDVNR